MAQATHAYTTSKFHNLSNEALADAIGHAEALLKGAEAECKALKEEFKSRGLRRGWRALHNHPFGSGQQPARRYRREEISRRPLAQVRDCQHHDGHPHQSRTATRSSGLVVGESF